MILCRLEDLAEDDARGVRVGQGEAATSIIVVRRAGAVRAYVNRCPHLGTPLDWRPDQFFDVERVHLQCATHGAKFRVADGLCVTGPCRGKSLIAVPVAVVDGAVALVRSSGDRDR